MALEPCPECGKPVSSFAQACAQCGYPVGVYRKVQRRALLYVASGVGVLGVAGVVVYLLILAIA